MSRYSGFPAHLLPLLLPLLLLAGCSTLRQIAAKYPAPDLKRIYLPAAQETEVIAERNPLVMIPGFGGSQLRDADGNIVWGAIYTKEALSFARAEGLRALALDVPEEPVPLSEEDAMAALYRLGDDSVASTAMVHFHTSVLVDVDFPIYARMLEGLATAGYRLEPPEVAAAVDAPRNPDGTPCFVFAFDWRLDLAGIAAQFERFLDESEAQVHAERKRRGVADDPEKPVRFDVVAHSMGALMARYYLRYGAHDVVMEDDPEITWEGSRRIDRFIMVSPPNRGTTMALRNLANGDDVPFFPAFQPAMVATWLSTAQMFPRREDGWLTDEQGRDVDLDLFDFKLWRDNGWGPYRKDQYKTIRRLFPGVPDPQERLQRLESRFAVSLRRGERFVHLMDRPPATPPPFTSLHLFAGDSEPTLARGRVVQRGGKLHLEFGGPGDTLNEPGDSSITRRSALGDLRPVASREWLRSSVPWSSAMFISDRHGSLLSNKLFQDNLLHLLLETPPGPVPGTMTAAE